MNAKALCLNMIVKNEMANLERCLAAVADHIACWIIGDTGSSDGSQDFIRSFFAARRIPGELHSFPFINFEQARNAGLAHAYASPMPYDYILLADADMELVVEDRDFRSKLEAPSYSVLQRSGVSYWNTRLVHRDAGARYHGLTHEYLDVPGGGPQLHGVWYKDHASGANRVDKFERDIRLLTAALEEEPESHRHWFYLAQSYRDAGRTAEAAEAYARRAAMGGWDEEAWYARMQQARCLRELGDEGGFLREALAAFSQRPHRAEPLYDLARFYRERGMNEASVLFAEAGLALKRPDGDTLFVEDFVYQTGLQEEFSIAANYSRDPARKDRGFAACNWLALNRDVPERARGLARHNLRFYVEPADKIMPSFAARPVGFTPPADLPERELIDHCDPTRLLDDMAHTVAETAPAIAAEEFRGGSQAIPFDDGRLALVHEVLGSETEKNRIYLHRFVRLDAAGVLRGVSRPFFFRKKGVELTAGLAWHPDEQRLIISYGADDGAAWLATVDAGEVRSLLADVERLPSGVLPQSADDGAAMLPTGRSFDLFDTLVARRCVHPLGIFDSVERAAGCAGFAQARRAAEAEISSGEYALDDIYRRLAEHYGVPPEEADRLKALELDAEAANLFPIAEHCREVGPNDVVVSDMYLPAEWLTEIVRDTCGLAPRGLYVSSHGKRSGAVWRTLRQTVRITEHVGDDPVTDLASARAAGIPARLTTVARRSDIEDELAAAGFAPLSNLIREARLATWHEDPALRGAQLAQVQLNFPLLFLATLHLWKLAEAQGWDHILMSGRDCYLWHDLYQRLRPHLPGAPTAAYFHTSRVARAHPSPGYLAYFAAQRLGRRNVVVDLCGTGWSLSRLIERAPAPAVDVFLLHKLEMPHLVRDYERFGALADPIAVHSVVARPMQEYDSEVLERMNFAPQVAVEDVRETPGGFAPVLSSLQYPVELAELISFHHRAFEHACKLLDTLTGDDIALMSENAVAPAIEATYRRLAGMLSQFEEFDAYKAREEELARAALRKASAAANVDAGEVRSLLAGVERLPSVPLETAGEGADASAPATLPTGRSFDLSDTPRDADSRPPSEGVSRTTGSELRRPPPLAARSRKRRIWLYQPYFGAFPNYFQLYLDSLGRNADCLSVFLVTDTDLSGYRVPDNLIPIPMTLATLRQNAARFIRDELGIGVRPDALLKEPYKLCDFRIMYPALFCDIGERYGASEDDFVGWGDCDLIYGRFCDFLNMDDDHHVIGGFHGHLTAVRNIDSFRTLFKAVADLPQLLVDEKPRVVDEIAFRKPLLDFLEQNRYQMFYINRYFCDIVPECFFGLFRKDHARRKKNFFDAYHPDKDIDHVYYDRDGRLTVVYDDGDSRQAIYCHLQKRAMSMNFGQYENGYYIREDSFSLAVALMCDSG